MILSRLAGANRSGSNLFIRKVEMSSSITVMVVNDYQQTATSKGLSKRQDRDANSRLQQELLCPVVGIVANLVARIPCSAMHEGC